MITKITPSTPAKATASGKIAETGQEITALTLAAGSGAPATAVIHNSEDNAGDEVWKLAAVAGGSDSISFPSPIKLSAGGYVTLAGAGAELSYAKSEV